MRSELSTFLRFLEKFDFEPFVRLYFSARNKSKLSQSPFLRTNLSFIQFSHRPNRQLFGIWEMIQVNHGFETEISQKKKQNLGSDENISAEAKRIRTKHLQERRKIKKLGNLATGHTI